MLSGNSYPSPCLFPHRDTHNKRALLSFVRNVSRAVTERRTGSRFTRWIGRIATSLTKPLYQRFNLNGNPILLYHRGMEEKGTLSEIQPTHVPKLRKGRGRNRRKSDGETQTDVFFPINHHR